MKKGLVLLLLLIIEAKAISQTLTADEIIKQTQCRTFQSFNEFITHKGFSYDHHSNGNEEDFYFYLSDDYIVPSSGDIGFRLKNLAEIGTSKKESFIAIQTVDKSYYLQLLADINSFGFVVFNTENTDKAENITGNDPILNKVCSYYKSSKFKNIIIIISVEKHKCKSDERVYINYNIDVTHFYY